MHKSSPTIDSRVTVQLWTPGSVCVEIPADYIQFDSVRKQLQENTPEGDARAALGMARITKLSITIKRETKTTVHASDPGV
jgi:hypothetical protein